MCVCVRGGGGGGGGAQSNFPTRDHQNIFNLILTHIFMGFFVCVVVVCFCLFFVVVVLFVVFFVFLGGMFVFVMDERAYPSQN